MFVAEAKKWGDKEGISARLFQAIGVPDEVLTEAGFEITAIAGSRVRTRSGTPSNRAPRIPFEDVEAAARKLQTGWKLADLAAAALDRDPGTVRNYINRLVTESIVMVVGDDPEHDGRGRAAKLYPTK